MTLEIRCSCLVTLKLHNFKKKSATVNCRDLNFAANVAPTVVRSIYSIQRNPSRMIWFNQVVFCDAVFLVSSFTLYLISPTRRYSVRYKCKGKQARCDPEGSSRFRLPDFHDIRHMKVARLLASHTGSLYP